MHPGMLSLHKWSSFLSELSFVSSVFTKQRCGYKWFGSCLWTGWLQGQLRAHRGVTHISAAPTPPPLIPNRPGPRAPLS